MRILRIIARLNVGGPAIQAITLSDRLDARGYRTLLLRGCEGQDEGNMNHLAHEPVQDVRLMFRKRGSLWRDHILNSRLKQRNQIELPFANNRAIGIDQRSFRFVQPE